MEAAEVPVGVVFATLTGPRAPRRLPFLAAVVLSIARRAPATSLRPGIGGAATPTRRPSRGRWPAVGTPPTWSGLGLVRTARIDHVDALRLRRGGPTRGDSAISTTAFAMTIPHVGDAHSGAESTGSSSVGAASPPPLDPDLDYDEALPPISDSTPSGEVLPLDGGFPSDGDLSPLPRGTRGGYRVVRHYSVPENGFDIDVDFDSSLRDASASDEEESSAPSASRRRLRRLEGLAGDNVTLPIALTLLDPRRYPTLTRARKACRRGSVLVHRGPIPIPTDVGGTGTGTCTGLLLVPPDAFLSDRCRRGRTDDRVHPGDVVGIQFNLGMYRRKRCYPNIAYGRPKFDLPVVYEDDHIAVVNKPAGIGVYWGGGGGGGGGGGEKKSRKRRRGASRRTVRDALPHVLTPPARGTVGGALRRPSAVHRLDVPTSGLLVVAKTRSAMVALCRQFEARTVRKTYTSVVNGVVPESRPWEGRVVPGDGDGDGHGRGRPPSSSAWSVVDYPLGGKSAVTEYRTVRRARSLNARDGTLSLVNLRPHTGRYHQLRRHMAWMCRRPMVGDALYAGLLQAPHFRRRGLYLCSDGVTLDHPYYNTPEGRREWDRMDEDKDGDEHRGGAIRLSDDGTMVQVSVSVELPKRFEKLLDGEEEWARMCTGTNVG